MERSTLLLQRVCPVPEKPVSQPLTQQKLRIGVWCDYGVTLRPTEGIGVFVYSLVAGLLELDEPLEIVMLVRPGDEDVVTVLGDGHQGRLKVIPEASRRASWMRLSDRARAVKKAIEHLLSWMDPAACRRRLRERCRAAAKASIAPVKRPLLMLGAIVAAVCLFVGVPVFCSRMLLRKPLRRWLRGIGQLERSAERQAQAERARAAHCDVWLIPSGDFHLPLSFPAVLALHDLVCIRFPEMWEKPVQRALEAAVRQRAAEATFCACMSTFIRDEDLVGILGLDSAKVRVIAPAPPVEPATAAQAAAPSSPRTRPYVFYPAAFRSYKNHRVLVEALGLLTAAGHNIDLIFTGIRDLPPELHEQIETAQLEERVHVLGCVGRSELDALYRGALATVIPALYEQGSFPIYEALRRGCPVACSRIAPFQEQCAALGNAMLYFDPRSARAVADTIETIMSNRKAIQEQQRQASQALWRRTWRDAAQEWFKLFQEAAASSKKELSPNRRQAA